ncbi:MAG: PLP-dependent aminotransferase family protein [Actinomycetota bacterium]
MVPVSRVSGRALGSLLPDLRRLPGPVYAALGDAIVSLVLDGRIAPEARLPSERELADQLAISRATVTAAYDALRGQGFLASRTGAGSFVTVPPDARPRVSTLRWAPATPQHADEIDLTCAALPAPPGVLPNAIARAVEQLPVLAAGSGYDPMGLGPLRAAVAERYTTRGVATHADQILITNGSLHAFDLLLRLLVGPGDRVLTELPTYPGALDALRGNGARIVPVPLAPEGGWQVGQIQATLRQTSPRLAYLIPDYHNPTGALVHDQDRRDVLRAARQAGTTVIVDESFVELGYGSSARPAAALDGTVVSIGSLSKPVWGGLRLGWVRGSADLVRRLAVQRAATDVAGSALDQLVGTVLFAELDAITSRRRAELQPRRDALISALHTHLPQWQLQVPEGGLSVWVELDAPQCTPLTQVAAQHGVTLVPGSRFGVDGTLERFLRLPFALPTERLEEAVRRIAAAWQRLDHSGAPMRQLVVA